MNRRDVFRGIGAVGINAMVPALPAASSVDTIIFPADPGSFIGKLHSGNKLGPNVFSNLTKTFLREFENARTLQIVSSESNKQAE